MGDSADNLYPIPHKLRGSGANSSTYALRRHLGSQSIDTTSEECDHSDWISFRNACLNGNDTAMDTAGNNAWGSWYDDNIVTPGNRTAMRAAVTETCS